MMDNSATNKSHISFPTWVTPTGWPTTSAQGVVVSSHTNSQHLGLNLSDQQPLYNHPQGSSQSCTTNMSTMSTETSSQNTAPHTLGNLILHNTSIPAASQLMSFSQQNTQTSSMRGSTSRGKTMSPVPLPQPNQGPQPCSSQHFPPLPANIPYKTFPAQLHGQALPDQDQSVNFPSCGLNMSQAAFGGRSGESTAVDGSSQSYNSPTSQEQPQWPSSSRSNGASSESTSTVDVNKQPSPETYSEKKRSLILNLREQLLNQLENVDKLLQTMPSDRDGQVDSSDEEQDELEEDEEMQESCCESGDDIESNYTPQSDDSLSECQSEDTVDSEDYNRDSSTKSPTNETQTTRTTREKKRKSEDSRCEEKSDSPPKKTCKTKTQPLSEFVVGSQPNKQKGSKSKKNYCLFCSKPVFKISRHLTNIHSDKAEVAIAFQYPSKSKERKRVWEKLIKEGNFAHNKEVLKTGKGELIVQKRPQKLAKSTDFVPCVHCFGLYKKQWMSVHMKRCLLKGKREEKSNGRKRVISKCVLLTKSCNDLSEELKNILGEMVYDEVTETVMEDRIILQFGEHLANDVIRSMKKREYIRQQLRAVGRLVLEAQKSTPMQSLEDFFDPSNFHHVVSAVKVLAGYDPKKKTYTLPSMAYKLGYDLKKVCGIVQQNAIKSGDTKVQKSCKTFLSLYDKKWKRLISSHALIGMKKSKRKNLKIVPFAEDVKCLYYHMETAYHLAEKNLRENVCPETYAALASVVLAQTIAFNRRKSGEVASITIKAFMLRKRSEVLDDLDVSVSNLERTLCGFFSRVDIRGSSGRIVPILLKPAFESAMELLINVREKCGVHSDNPFVFARTCGLSAYRGSDCIQKYANGCGAKNPKALTSMKLRKHFSTMLQLIHLDENEAQQIFGPNNQIQSMVQNNQCVNTEMESEATGSHPKTKHIWIESEVQAVEKHLMQFITNQKIPQKDDCVRCLEAEPLALKIRTWKGVKDYVRNRITTLQRQNSSSKVSSETSNRQKQKELQKKKCLDNVRLQPSNIQAAVNHSVVSTSSFGPGNANQQRNPGVKRNTATSNSKKAREKGPQHKPKPKWSEAEVRAVEEHLMHLIKEYKLPQKDDCVRCLEAEPLALRNRTWKGVKDYVRNRITTLQRQSGSRKVSSKPSVRRRQKEPQQSSVRPQPTERQEVVTEQPNLVSSSNFGPVHFHQQVHEVTTNYYKTSAPKPAKSSEKVSCPKTKHKWDEAEVSAVERHLMSFIEEHKLPQKDDCVRCLAAEPHALRNRSWKGVKDYVRNRITTSLRQCSFSRNTAKTSKRSRQEKPQQSYVYYQQL